MDEQKNISAPSDTQTSLSSLLSDPDALRRMSDAIGRLGIFDGAENESEQSPSADAQGSAEKEEGALSPLSSILSDPQIMSKIPSVLSLIGSLGESPAHKKSPDKREALLIALRPYLSDRRRTMVDYLIKMNKISDLLKNLK